MEEGLSKTEQYCVEKIIEGYKEYKNGKYLIIDNPDKWVDFLIEDIKEQEMSCHNFDDLRSFINKKLDELGEDIIE